MRATHNKVTVLFVCGVLLAFCTAGGFYYFLIHKNGKQLTPKDYMNNPIEIEIPVKYIMSVDQGLTIEKIENMQVTCYCNRPEETDSTPNHTATGRIVYEGSCAVSQDLFNKTIMPGDIVYVELLRKYFIVEDTMNIRHKRAIDIFMDKKYLKKASDFGMKRSNVYVMRLEYRRHSGKVNK